LIDSNIVDGKGRYQDVFPCLTPRHSASKTRVNALMARGDLSPQADRDEEHVSKSYVSGFR